MLSSKGSFIKIWEIEKKPTFTTLQFSTSKKNKDGEYVNSSWKGIAFKETHEKLKDVNKGDRIKITDFSIEKEKYNDKIYEKVTIWGVEVEQSEKPKTDLPQGFDIVEDDEIPF